MAGKTSADISRRARNDQVENPGPGPAPSGGFSGAFRGIANSGPGSIADVSTTGPFDYNDNYVTESVPSEALQTVLVPRGWHETPESWRNETPGTRTYTRALTDDDWRKKIFSDLGWNEPTQEDSDRAKERAEQTDVGKRVNANLHPRWGNALSDWRDLTSVMNDPSGDITDLFIEYGGEPEAFDISQHIVNRDFSEKDLRNLSQAMFGLAGKGRLPKTPSRAENDFWDDEWKEYAYGGTDTGWYMDHPYDAAENLSGYERALAKLQYELDKAKENWNRSRSDWGVWPDFDQLRWERETREEREEEMRALAQMWNREREYIPFEEWNKKRKERMYADDIPF